MDKQKSIEALQFFATGLTEGALVHKLQGQIFKAQGFEKLGQKYIDHFNEEMEWVEKFVERIPEASSGRHSNLSTIGFAIGFVLMMVLDVVMG